ncbi:MAG: hypothetical protein HY960_11420 [Ignavibacteriae bacterium]|nr:hypothetical protein [Ignavibacteriota bacterium]
MLQDEKNHILTQELLEYFQAVGFEVRGVRGDFGFPQPALLHNDGYGDQQGKMPDIFAYDTLMKEYVLGIVRTSFEELDIEASLTEYDVFLDQKDKQSGKSYRLFIIVPSSLVSEMNSLITHYIHRELWHLVTVVASRKIL